MPWEKYEASLIKKLINKCSSVLSLLSVKTKSVEIIDSFNITLKLFICIEEKLLDMLIFIAIHYCQYARNIW